MHLVQNSESYVIYAKSLFVKEENIQNMGKKVKISIYMNVIKYGSWLIMASNYLTIGGRQSGQSSDCLPTISRYKGHHSGTCGNMIARNSSDFDWLIFITNKP